MRVLREHQKNPTTQWVQLLRTKLPHFRLGFHQTLRMIRLFCLTQLTFEMCHKLASTCFACRSSF